MKEYRILEKKYKYRSEFQIQWRTKDTDDVLPFTIVHNPWVDNFDQPTKQRQTLQFIEKGPISTEDKTLITINDGTTNEEVIAVLLDRMDYLQYKFPCTENAMAITKLQEALMWLNKHTQDRIKRNVEGTNQM